MEKPHGNKAWTRCKTYYKRRAKFRNAKRKNEKVLSHHFFAVTSACVSREHMLVNEFLTNFSQFLRKSNLTSQDYSPARAPVAPTNGTHVLPLNLRRVPVPHRTQLRQEYGTKNRPNLPLPLLQGGRVPLLTPPRARVEVLRAEALSCLRQGHSGNGSNKSSKEPESWTRRMGPRAKGNTWGETCLLLNVLGCCLSAESSWVPSPRTSSTSEANEEDVGQKPRISVPMLPCDNTAYVPHASR